MLVIPSLPNASRNTLYMYHTLVLILWVHIAIGVNYILHKVDTNDDDMKEEQAFSKRSELFACWVCR